MKALLTVIFTLSFLGLFVASAWYVAFRLRSLFGLSSRWLLRTAVLFVLFGSNAAMLSGARSTTATAGLVNLAGGFVFTYSLFFVIGLLLLHAIERRVTPPRRWVAGSALALPFIATAAGALWAGRFGVDEAEIRLAGLQQDVVVMQISDVHLGHHRGEAYLEQIVAETNRRQPDVILITGDLVDSDIALLPGVLSPLKELEAPAFFVGGNHENYVDTPRAFAAIADQGIRVLHNELIETHGFYLIGLDYMNPDDETFDLHPSDDKRTIESVLPTIALPSDKPSVLMHHSPVGTKYVSAKGIDLMVAGHTHGGQIFPATLFARLFFRFNDGLYDASQLQVYVSQGVGTYGPRIRLGTSNELNLVRLRADDKTAGS